MKREEIEKVLKQLGFEEKYKSSYNRWTLTTNNQTIEIIDPEDYESGELTDIFLFGFQQISSIEDIYKIINNATQK